YLQSFVTREAVLVDNGWDRHLKLFSLLKAEDMSGDETDRDQNGKKIHPPSFTVEELRWPSDQYKTFMCKLDESRYDSWKSPTVGGGYRGGNGPRTRRRRGKFVDTPAPKGLYRNCYDQAWLRKLKQPHLRALHVIDEDYDFSL
ncbi:hypothetical protein GY45DRAFT_1212616, partial [Cubamyces sp. BRFM 1775]